MSGRIYCFTTVADARLYKAGETTQETVQKRLRSYLGPSRPRCVIVDRAVCDARRAESLFLRLLRQCAFFRARTDLGAEWFEATDARREARDAAVRLLADVAAAATRGERDQRDEKDDQWKKRDAGLWTEDWYDEASHDATSLPGLEGYFAQLDDFLRVAPEDVLTRGMDHALSVYEDRKHCPVFAEYLRYQRATRLLVAQNRHPHLS